MSGGLSYNMTKLELTERSDTLSKWKDSIYRYFHVKPRFTVGTCISLAFLAFSLLFLLLTSIYGAPFYFNSSPSAPTGVYMISFEKKPVLHKNDYVVVTCPYAFPEIHIDADTVFLKRVEGLGGETFEINDYSLVKDGKVYPINHTLSYLPHLKNGKYTIREDQVLLLNDMDYSLDSRYFGPLPKNLVIHRVHLLFTFQSVDNTLIKILPDWLLLKFFGYIPAPSIDKNIPDEEFHSLGLT